MRTIDSLSELQRQLRLVLPQKENWRLAPRPFQQGEINGLPGSHGYLVATNGPLCILYNPSLDVPFLGHTDWFIPWRGTKTTTSWRGTRTTAKVLSRYNI